MTEYAGCRSLDAEIKLDLIKGVVDMDYSLNRHGRSMDSNTSVVIDNDTWKQLTLFQKLKFDFTQFLFLCILVIPFEVFMLVFTMEQQIGIVGKSAQYEYQKILKWYFSRFTGIYEQSKSGELVEPIILFTVPHNIWIEYVLDGDYQKNIKSISLVRNFITWYRMGIFPCKKQQGWNVVFEFTELPKSGSCKIKYV